MCLWPPASGRWDSLPSGVALPHRPLLTGLCTGTPASSLRTGLFPLAPASSATCGTQVGASGSPRVKAPSGSRGVPLEAATVAGALLASTGGVVSSPMAPSASCGERAVASGAPRVKVPSGSRGAPLEAAAPASAVLAGLSTVPDVLNDFPDVVNVGKTLSVLSHDVQHHIRTSGPPIASRFRRLEGAKLEAARREFEEMERDGIVQRSTSPWASPLHMVPKKDGTWRPCGDFRRLNLVTEPDVYPLPNMLDFADRLSGCTVFSKIDLRKGYWQIPVRPEDRPKTAVITPFGLFKFLRMPFGLRNAGSSFQRMMDRVLAGLPFVYCYLDDLHVASPSLEAHRQHLRAVFERLRLFGLVINLEKCVFAVDSFEFLGHVVSAQGAKPISSYVEAVEQRPPPTTIKELQVFLGLVNFYRRFLPGVAVILRPLTYALKGGRAASDLLAWTPEMEASFMAVKAALGEATLLGHPDPEATCTWMLQPHTLEQLYTSNLRDTPLGSLWDSFRVS
jgi:hypothetical protein